MYPVLVVAMLQNVLNWAFNRLHLLSDGSYWSTFASGFSEEHCKYDLEQHVVIVPDPKIDPYRALDEGSDEKSVGQNVSRLKVLLVKNKLRQSSKEQGKLKLVSGKMWGCSHACWTTKVWLRKKFLSVHQTTLIMQAISAIDLQLFENIANCIINQNGCFLLLPFFTKLTLGSLVFETK